MNGGNETPKLPLSEEYLILINKHTPTHECYLHTSQRLLKVLQIGYLH